MESILIIILAVQTIFLLAVGFFLFRLGRQVQKTTEDASRLLEEIRPKLKESVDGIHDFVKTVQPMGEQLVDISINLKEIIDAARDVTDDVTDFVKDTTDTARRQVSYVDGLVTDTVKKVEFITTNITDNLLNPLAEISAFFKGIRAAIGYLRVNDGRVPSPSPILTRICISEGLSGTVRRRFR